MLPIVNKICKISDLENGVVEDSNILGCNAVWIGT
jgi:hypothetical protein